MNEAPGFIFYVIAFLLVLGPLVFLHELGHYAAGRFFGIKAEAFSIGFGREIGGFTDKRGTRWKFGWLPLGGYVKFAGDMNPAGQPSPEWLALPAAERAQTFQAKPLWQRAIVVAAGPVTNFLVAIVILAGLALWAGEPRTPPVVAGVAAESGAAEAGLLAGDRIATIGGRDIDNFEDLRRYIAMRPDEAVDLTVVRDGTEIEMSARIGVRTEKDRFGNVFRIGQLGVAPVAAVREPVGVGGAIPAAVRMTIGALRAQIDGMGQIVTGRRSVSELGGPLRIAQVSGDVMVLGAVQFIALIALISINLGFINLLPVPVLDGGHLLFYAIEAVRRKPVEPHVMEWAFRGGMMAILALMLLVTFNDLGAFGVWRNLAGLIG